VGAVLLDAVVAGLVLGWVFRGRFVNLAEVEIRGVALAVLGVLLQFVRQYGASAGWPLVREWAPVFYVGTFWILLALIWLNRRNPAFLLIGFGIFLNMLVIAANGGKMPVSAESLARAGFDPGPIASGQVITHQLLTETTRLAFLADVLVLGKPYPRPVVFRDRKSTRLNSSHVKISYAVFCFTRPSSSSSLSLHDALPICDRGQRRENACVGGKPRPGRFRSGAHRQRASHHPPASHRDHAAGVPGGRVGPRKAVPAARGVQHRRLAAVGRRPLVPGRRSEEHTSELQSRENLVCRLLLEKKKLIYNL